MELFLEIVCIAVASIFAFIILKYLFLLTFISFAEGYRKKKARNEDSKTPQLNTEPVQAHKSSKIKKVLLNFYYGCYKYLVFKLGVFPSKKIRIFIYRHVLKMKIGKNVVMHHKTEIRDGYRIEIGNGTIIGDNCLLDGRGKLIIKNNVVLSANASIYTAQHDYNSHDFAGVYSSVTICDRAWISSNTVILPGVTVGEGAVLAAGGIASKDLKPFTLYGGVPAKEIKERTSNIDYEFDGSADFFL